MITVHGNPMGHDDLRDTLFRALSDRSRRRIIQVLGSGPLTPRDIASVLEDPTRISYHLRVLKDAGIVRVLHGPARRVTYEFVRTSLCEIERLLEEALFLRA